MNNTRISRAEQISFLKPKENWRTCLTLIHQRHDSLPGERVLLAGYMMARTKESDVQGSVYFGELVGNKAH